MIQPSTYCVYPQRKWKKYVKGAAVCPSYDILNNSLRIKPTWVSMQKNENHLASLTCEIWKITKEKSQSKEKSGLMKAESLTGMRELLASGYQFSVKLE